VHESDPEEGTGDFWSRREVHRLDGERHCYRYEAQEKLQRSVCISIDMPLFMYPGECFRADKLLEDFIDLLLENQGTGVRLALLDNGARKLHVCVPVWQYRHDCRGTRTTQASAAAGRCACAYHP
jgi:hypothetical protein